MGLEFTILNWSAWAPGLATRDAWEAWARAPSTPVGAETPPLSEVPAMQRRRIEKMGRLAFQVGQWVQQDAHGLPLVFASRHGDAPRSVELLTSLAKTEPLSPASFALSVHNAIGGQYSIIRHDVSNVVAVANGLLTPEAGLIEALTLAPEALLVVYEASPNPLHAPYYPEGASDYAFAWHVKRGGPLSLHSEPAPGVKGDVGLPHALRILHFFLSGAASYAVNDGQRSYVWRRA